MAKAVKGNPDLSFEAIAIRIALHLKELDANIENSPNAEHKEKCENLLRAWLAYYTSPKTPDTLNAVLVAEAAMMVII